MKLSNFFLANIPGILTGIFIVIITLAELLYKLYVHVHVCPIIS